MMPPTRAGPPPSRAAMAEAARPQRTCKSSATRRNERAKAQEHESDSHVTVSDDEFDPKLNNGDQSDEDYVDSADSREEAGPMSRYTISNTKGTSKGIHDTRIVSSSEILSTAELKHQYDFLRQRHYELVGKLEDGFKQLKNKYSVERKASSKLREAKKSLKDKIADLLKKVEELETQLAEQEVQVVLAQSHMNEHHRNNVNVGLPDEMIRQKLKELKSLLRPWCKDNAAPDLIDITHAAYRRFIGPWAPNTQEFTVSRIHKRLSKTNSGPSILLNAVLAYEVYQPIIGTPFELLNMLDLTTHVVPGLRKAFNTIRSNNIAQAHAWRSNTLNLLFPSTATATTKELVQQHCLGRAEGFLNRVKPLLRASKPADQGRRLEELRDIFTGAILLSMQLGKQKSAVVVHYKDLFGESFCTNADTFEPHASMRCDGSESVFDGQYADMVVEPSVQAYGNEEGTGYEERRIWLKGTVLILPNTGVKSKEATNLVPVSGEKRPADDNISARPEEPGVKRQRPAKQSEKPEKRDPTDRQTQKPPAPVIHARPIDAGPQSQKTGDLPSSSTLNAILDSIENDPSHGSVPATTQDLWQNAARRNCQPPKNNVQDDPDSIEVKQEPNDEIAEKTLNRKKL